jgi:phage tail tape-measure protein
MVGGALGSVVPGIGTAIGSQAGAAAADMFEMELEGMSAEDQEFEVARRVVRLAGEAAQQAAQTPPTVPPPDAAKAAVVAAAQQHAPGLLRQPSAAHYGRRHHSGRWVRRGHTIVLYGL